MSLDHKDWATLAAFSRPGNALLDSIDLVVSREDAQSALGRAPDFEDSRVVSWGRLTLEECARLVALEPDPEFHAETLAILQGFFDAVGPPIVTLYYADPHRGY